jgi:acyl-CoA thioesterase I
MGDFRRLLAGMRSLRSRSYGVPASVVQSAVLAAALVVFLGLFLTGITQAADAPIKLVALGDSLSAGYNLPASAAFPVRLERALRAKGHTVEVANAGVPDGTDGVIVELGANDMLRGFDPTVTQRALEEIVRRLTERRIVVLIAGMRAMPNLGINFANGFEAIYPELASKYDALLYPFFLDGVAGDSKLNQRDGLHPTAAGIDVIVGGIMPKVEELIARVRRQRGS